MKAKVTFHGGVGIVTGANFMLETPESRCLIDCGLIQGVADAELINRRNFSFDPKTVDFLFVTHAHIDHIGRIPKLVRDGFKGVIFSTKATKEIAKEMLIDALKIMTENDKQKGLSSIYEQSDIDRAMEFWKIIPYHQKTALRDLDVTFYDAGHILGSAMIGFEKNARLPDKEKKSIIFSGDLGNSPALFLRDTDIISNATYLIMESVYGDRNHETKEERTRKLTEIINQIIDRRQTLLISSFSLERTQDILYEINSLVEKKIIEAIPVFLDSPLAQKITEIYERHSDIFKNSAREMIGRGDDLFSFSGLRLVSDIGESRTLRNAPNPKIIIAGSGMSLGGRIRGHEKYYLPSRDATLLLVGYQSVGTLGREIADGAKYVNIDGVKIPVRADIVQIHGYSSHKDSDHLVDFVSNSADCLKKVFVVMGETKASLALVQRLRDNLGVDAIMPRLGSAHECEL